MYAYIYICIYIYLSLQPLFLSVVCISTTFVQRTWIKSPTPPLSFELRAGLPTKRMSEELDLSRVPQDQCQTWTWKASKTAKNDSQNKHKHHSTSGLGPALASLAQQLPAPASR